MNIEITPELLGKLRKRAEKCQPPIWKLDPHWDVASDSHTVAECGFAEDALHIAAADPATVLALIEEIDRLTTLTNQTDNLQNMLKQIWYMARRYADGRSTAAPSIVNEVYDKCQKMGIDLGDDNGERYAQDRDLGQWLPEKQTFAGKPKVKPEKQGEFDFGGATETES